MVSIKSSKPVDHVKEQQASYSKTAPEFLGIWEIHTVGTL